MTTMNWNLVNQVVEQITHCPYCKAQPGEVCVTSGGNPTQYIHAQRGTEIYEIAHTAWDAGWQQGVKIGKQRGRNEMTAELRSLA